MPLPDECLDALDGGARVGNQFFRRAVVLVDRVNDLQDGFALAGGVVRRQRSFAENTGTKAGAR